MPPELLFDIAKLDFNHIVADGEAIRRFNQQRFEMEQLDAVVHIDTVSKVIVGYKDIRADAFWARGHMPGYPLMPGVLMCEAAAQLCSFYTTSNNITGGDFLGFGGMENVRFRGVVRPGDRLVIVAQSQRLTARQCRFGCQGFVGSTMVFHADIIGMPMRRGGGAEE